MYGTMPYMSISLFSTTDSNSRMVTQRASNSGRGTRRTTNTQVADGHNSDDAPERRTYFTTVSESHRRDAVEIPQAVSCRRSCPRRREHETPQRRTEEEYPSSRVEWSACQEPSHSRLRNIRSRSRELYR